MIDDDMLAAFDATFATAPELKAASKPRNRRAAEKRHGLRHDDGRRKRATGRTAQFNLKIRPEYKARMTEIAQSNGVLLAELAEQAFDLLFQQIAATKGKKR